MLPANPQHQYELDNKIFARLQIEFRSLPNGHERNPPPQTKIGPPTPLPLLILLHIFSFGLLLALTTWAQQLIRVLYFFVVLNYLLMLSSLWVLLLLLLQICGCRQKLAMKYSKCGTLFFRQRLRICNDTSEVHQGCQFYQHE